MPVLSAWSPHTRRDIKKLEQVLRQSTRFIIEDFSHFSSVTSMLTDLNIPIALSTEDNYLIININEE